MNKILSVCAVLMLVSAPIFAHAGPIIRTGESVSIDAAQVLEGDFYGFSQSFTLSGTAKEDVHILGGTVTVNAPILKDLTIVGGAVQIHGDVGDDLRVVGGEVVLATAVKGDVAIFGGKLTILSTAEIDGDVLFMGGDLVIEGDVKGTVKGNANSTRINGIVGGDVLVHVAHTLALGDGARVSGDVLYTSMNPVLRSQNAVIQGTVKQSEPTLETGMNFFKFYILFVCTILFTAVTLFFGARKYMEGIVEVSVRKPGISGLIGLGVFLVAPFLVSMLFVSMIGVPLGMSLLLFYITMLLIAFITSGTFVGVYVQKLMTKKQTLSLSAVLYGTSLIAAIALVPIVGGLIAFACLMITFGSVVTHLYQRCVFN